MNHLRFGVVRQGNIKELLYISLGYTRCKSQNQFDGVRSKTQITLR